MSSSSSLYSPRYWPTWIGIGLLRLFEPLPYSVLRFLGACVGTVARVLPLRFRRIARRNLALAFPDMPAAERTHILNAHFRSLGIGLFETSMTWWSSDQRILSLTRLEGAEHLKSALAQGHGAILLGSHFTTLEIGCRALCVRFPTNIMYRPSRDPVLARFLLQRRSLHARRAIPRDDIRTLVGALAANEPVWFAPDQSYRKKGAQMVPFFGIPAATNTATSRLARISGAPVLPFFCERLPGDGGYRVVIHPPLEGFPSGDAIVDASRIHELIESQVRRVPEQFLWIHRRFKGLGPDYPDHYGPRVAADRGQ